jgi:hypothetical protein
MIKLNNAAPAGVPARVQCDISVGTVIDHG